MAQPPDPAHQRKRETLRRHGTLNPEPESVTDPLFHSNDFFDPSDLVQVKYEMLRRVHVDSVSVSESARALACRVRRSIKRKLPTNSTASSGCCLTSGGRKAGTSSLAR